MIHIDKSQNASIIMVASTSSATGSFQIFRFYSSQILFHFLHHFQAAVLSYDEHGVSLAVSRQIIEIQRLSFDEECGRETIVFLQLAVFGFQDFERFISQISTKHSLSGNQAKNNLSPTFRFLV